MKSVLSHIVEMGTTRFLEKKPVVELQIVEDLIMILWQKKVHQMLNHVWQKQLQGKLGQVVVKAMSLSVVMKWHELETLPNVSDTGSVYGALKLFVTKLALEEQAMINVEGVNALMLLVVIVTQINNLSLSLKD